MFSSVATDFGSWTKRQTNRGKGSIIVVSRQMYKYMADAFELNVNTSFFFIIDERRVTLHDQLVQLCTARLVLPILLTVWLYTVMPEVCRCLTNEKQRKTDIGLTDQ